MLKSVYNLAAVKKSMKTHVVTRVIVQIDEDNGLVYVCNGCQIWRIPLDVYEDEFLPIIKLSGKTVEVSNNLADTMAQTVQSDRQSGRILYDTGLSYTPKKDKIKLYITLAGDVVALNETYINAFPAWCVPFWGGSSSAPVLMSDSLDSEGDGILCPVRLRPEYEATAKAYLKAKQEAKD